MRVFFWHSFYFGLFLFVNDVLTKVECSGRQSQLVITSGATFQTNVPIDSFSGSILLDEGGVLIGNNIIFANGVFNAENDSTTQVSGNFAIDASNSPLLNELGSSNVSFFGSNILKLSSNINLLKSWTFSGNSSIVGNGNIIDLSDPGASINLLPGANIVLTGLYVTSFDLQKFHFFHQTSTLTLVDSVLALDANLTVTIGNIIASGNSQVKLVGNSILFSDLSTFTVSSGSNLWLDNSGSSASPIFSYVVTDTSEQGYHLTSFIDNTSVRILVDHSQVQDPAVSALISGQIPLVVDPTNPDPGAGAVINITQDTPIPPQEQIIVQNNVEMNGGGSSLTFANTGQPQFVVSPGKTATFGNIDLLRISNSTFDLNSDSTVRFKNNAVLEFTEDVYFRKGSFVITGDNSSVLLRGLGGRKRLIFTDDGLGGSPATFDIGLNDLILEDIELVGVENFSQDRSIVNNSLKEGRIVMTGQSKVNIKYNTNLNFLIRGDSTKIALLANNLVLSGHIRFDDFSDSNLHIGFNIDDNNTDLVLGFDKDTVLFSSLEAKCGITFLNDKVTLQNKTSTSFVVKSRSDLAGNSLKISLNPILQETTLFSLAPGLDLTSDLALPIDLSGIPPQEIIRGDETDYRFEGRTTKAISIPRALITVRNKLFGVGISKTVAVRQGAFVNSFSPSSKSPLNLIMLGGATAQTIVRRTAKLSAQILRDLVLTSTTDTTIDKLKPGDSIYVKGVNNKIIVTGLLDFYGKIIMDEGAELIFAFDDSVDSAKGIRFSSEFAGFLQNLPPTSSIVFDGDGMVFFANGSILSMQGSPISELQPLGNGFVEDDRPSLIFRNYAQLIVDSNNKLLFKGRGKLVFQNGGLLDVEQGLVQLGSSDQDFFDLVVGNNAAVRIGSSQLQSADSVIANVALSQGLFSCRFTRGANLSVRNGGLFEIGMLQGNITGGILSEGTFNRGSSVNVLSQGIFAWGIKDLSPATLSDTMLSWDNTDGTFAGAGLLSLFTAEESSAGLVSGGTGLLSVNFAAGRLQNNQIYTDSISVFDLFKGLIRVTPTLINASDFIDGTGGYDLITPTNAVVGLEAGDVIRREGPDSGNVYGTTTSGVRFAILPDGTRQIFS